MTMMRLPEHYFGRNVMRCSGGERQRVALARAFAYDPEILFFDEPLSALDYKLKKALEKELKDMHKETGKTFIYITHSLEEAMVMSDRIAVMRAGRIVQIGTPEEIYTRPLNRFVAEFMGEVNVLPVRGAATGCFASDEVPGTLPRRRRAAPATGYVVVRPEFLRLSRSPGDAENVVEGMLYNSYSLGSRQQYRVRVGDKLLVVEQSRAAGRRAGARQPGPRRLGQPRRALRGELRRWRRPTSAAEQDGDPGRAPPPAAVDRRPLRAAGLRAARSSASSRRSSPIIAFSFATPRSFDAFRSFTLANYARDLRPGQHRLPLLRLVAGARRR